MRDYNATLMRLIDMGENEILLPFEQSVETETPPETVRQIPVDKAGIMEELVRGIDGCTKCELCKTRNKIVSGMGDPDANIVFVGEAPGAEEDKTGVPFVGRAGKLLDRIFAAMKLSRERGIYIANILKCRPPGNRDPLPGEVEMCIPYLISQLKIIRPNVICCLGRIAAQNLLGTSEPLGRLRGKTHYYNIDDDSIPVIVTYHPAYLLRNSAGKKPVWEDMKELLRIAGLPVPL